MKLTGKKSVHGHIKTAFVDRSTLFLSDTCLSSANQQTVQILMSCALGKWDNYPEIDVQVGDGEDRWKSTFECFPLFGEAAD